MNTDYFLKFKNSLDTEIKLVIRCRAALLLLLCSAFVYAFEFLYILPYDRVTGNSIALSSWITQIHIILGVAFGVMIYEKENRELKELISSLSATGLKNTTKILIVFFHGGILFMLSSVFALLSLSMQKADFILIASALKYIGVYWILPFVIACFMGLLISGKTNGKMKYVFALLFIIISGPMLPTLLEPMMDTRTGVYKYISFFNMGPLYAAKPMHLMFGYSIPFEKNVAAVLLMSSFLLLFLLSGVYHSIRKYLGMMIALCLMVSSYVINFHYIAANYDYEIAMDMYETYSAESKLKANNNYKILSMDIGIDEQSHSFDFNTIFKIKSDKDLSYLTFTLYHGFQMNRIRVNGAQCTNFVREKDLIAIMDSFESGKEYEIELKYSGVPAMHMYSSYKNWILPEYFAWYPMQGDSQNIIYSNDLFDVNFVFQEPPYDIDFHIKMHGDAVLYCNLAQTGENEWSGSSKGITLLDSDFMKMENDGKATYLYPVSCQNYVSYIGAYQENLVKYQKVLDMPISDSSTLIFICDTTYTGHGEKITTCKDETFIEITRAYIDGTELKNPNLGIYALLKDKYLRGVTDVDFEYLFTCSYMVSLSNQGIINNDDVVRDLEDLHHIYQENAGYDDFARLTEALSSFITTSTSRQQATFFDAWATMLRNHNYDISQTIALVQRLLSNYHIDLPNFPSASLSSISVATATPHSSALHMEQLFCVNIAET